MTLSVAGAAEGSELSSGEGHYSYNNFGGIGLLEMRTARFAPDGMLAVGIHYDNQKTRYFSTWQATPWLETTLSYSDDKSANLGVDRSLDLKIRLWKEGDYRPQFAIGIQDAFGDGRASGEYFVASKRYYAFDFTMGFSWGYLGSRGGIGNMFGPFGNNFDHRTIAKSSGGFRDGSYFSGKDMAFFAGFEYHPPIKNLSIKVEYSGVDTRNTSAFSHLVPKTAFNFGVNYRPVPWVDVAIGFDHGDHVGIRLTLKQNLHSMKLGRWFKDIPPPPILERHKAIILDNLPKVMAREISSAILHNDALFDRFRRLGAKIIEVEQKQDAVSLTIKMEDHAETSPMVLLGAALDRYDKVMLNILDEKSSPVSEDKVKIKRYDASKSDVIGQGALDEFRKTAVFLRENDLKNSISSTANGAAMTTYNDMKKAKLLPISVVVDKQKVEVRKRRGAYFSEMRNVGRTARILTQNMPVSIEKFVVISEDNGLETSHISLLRKDFEKANQYQSSPEEIWQNSTISVPNAEPYAVSNDRTVQVDKEGNMAADEQGHNLAFDWGFRPKMLTHFGGNNDGRFRADLYATLFGTVQIDRQLKLSTEITQYLMGNIDKIPVDSNPNVPHVRSDVSRYSKEGRTAIERLRADYTTEIGPELYLRLTGGLMERMFGGIGAEVLYRPYEHSFAFGLDMNWVKQRSFDQLFSFQDYDVITGHATFYHVNENYNITSKVSVGRYLAGDFGATVDVSRRFSNGVRLGFWATVTDMSSDDFGNGRFDKGIYLTLPLETFWYKPSVESFRFNFRSLGKNGGQMLDKGERLYDILSSGRKNILVQEWQEILD